MCNRVSEGGAYLDEPCPLSETVETEFIGNFSSVHSIWEILFVGEDKEESIAELVFVKHPLQLLTSLGNTLSIVGIDNENDTLCVLEV